MYFLKQVLTMTDEFLHEYTVFSKCKPVFDISYCILFVVLCAHKENGSITNICVCYSIRIDLQSICTVYTVQLVAG